MIRNLLALVEINYDRKRSEANLLKLQKKRLYKLLCYVNKQVPFYQQYFDSIHYNPEKDFSGLDDLKLLPVIRKQTIRDHGYEQFMSNGFDLSKLMIEYSSGSTGEPFKFYRNRQFYAYQLAILFSILQENGYRFTDKMLTFTNPARLQRAKSHLQKFHLIRRLAIDYNLSPAESLHKIMEYKPQVLYGNPSNIELVILEMIKQDLKVDFVKIIVAGGTSISDACRQGCLEHFGVKITEIYAAVEFSIIAYKNGDESNYHLCKSQNIFEFLDENNEDVKIGENGKIVVTSLNSKALPFLRYEIGDIASTIIEKNDSGENALKIKQLIGRDGAVATLKDGRKIAYQHIYTLLNKHTGIIQFKIVQDKIDQFTIYLVTESEKYFNDNIEILRTKFDNLFRDSANYSIEKVQQLLIERGGKIKNFVPL